MADLAGLLPPEDDIHGLEAVGATAVNAASVEQIILRQVENATEGATNEARTDLEVQQQHLWAVRRELRAVRAAVQKMDEPVQEAPYEGEESAPAPLAQGELQQAVMRERLAGLEKQAADLEAALAAAGVAPAPQIDEEAVQEALQKATKGAKGKRKGRNVQFDLEEADLFDAAEAAAAAAHGRGASLVETERDRLIRLGVLTPFDRLGGFERRVETAAGPSQQGGIVPAAMAAASIARVGQRVREIRESRHSTKLLDVSELPRPQRQAKRVDEGFWRASASGRDALPKKRRISTLPRASAKRRRRHASTEEGVDFFDDESDEEEEDSGEEEAPDELSTSEEEELLDENGKFDDADEDVYRLRQKAYLQKARRNAAAGTSGRRRRRQNTNGEEEAGGESEEGEEEESDLESEEDGDGNGSGVPDVIFEGGYRVPGDLYSKLFDYQRTGVKWLWELYTQRAGGIIGDEMGLGKTIQIIAFLAGLHHSGKFKTTLVICPATVLNQWLREIRAWYPPFRVAILHESGGSGGKKAGGSQSALVRRIASSASGILLTTYEQLRLRRDALLPIPWGCVVLDEGHKIRNPDAEVTLVAKQLATVHRLIMTGSPIQNRLTELWSLFDFVFPGKLGTLPVFQAQFAVPIQIGGYTNASPLQVAAAYRCAVVLRDLISPYLLRRRKSDVATALPKKTERVLFCSLTLDQREMYRSYLASKELGDILSGNRAALAGIDVLRKICNHPDLLERAKWETSSEYGASSRSGKLQVLDKVLEHWHQGGHKVLVFTQTQQMLDIIERLVVAKGWSHHRMDGGTPVAMRSRLIDDFNNNPHVFVFLLTTRVGGLGVNLTGANRCVIFDPDWNPSTDVQARERAWRIGQSREVTVYRLITSGTIEEKVYHRQVYKQFLTDKVLRDPRQRRFFKARDLSDLFTLGDEYAEGTETAEIFASLDTEIRAEDLAGGVQGEEGGAAGGGGNTRDIAAPSPSGGGARSGRGSPSDRDDYESGREQPSGSQRNSDLKKRGQQLALGASVREEEAEDPPPGSNDAPQNGGGSGDAKILRDLFDGAAVHAALDHDKIEGAHDPARRVAEKEAAKIAKRAAEALRQSRMQLQRAPINQPTWTGRSGAAGAPGSGLSNAVPRFGAAINPRLQSSMAVGGAAGGANGGAAPRFGAGRGAGTSGSAALPSSELLARMRERQHAATSLDTQHPELSRAQSLAERVASFLQGRGGSAPSAEVASAFQRTINAGDLALFKSVLKSVAKLERQRGVGKVWVLRPEFVADTQ